MGKLATIVNASDWTGERLIVRINDGFDVSLAPGQMTSFSPRAGQEYNNNQNIINLTFQGAAADMFIDSRTGYQVFPKVECYWADAGGLKIPKRFIQPTED